MTSARRLLLVVGGGGSFILEDDEVALGWYNVKTYGATGDGSTDDTSSINAAIAALNSNGGGRLYFPHGTYRITSALTTITVPCVVFGDGSGGFPYASGVGSTIEQESDTANALTFSDDGWTVEHLCIVNTEGTPTAGAGIASANAIRARMFDVTVSGFYDCIDLSDGAGWTLTDSHIHDPVRYGIRIRGTVSPDSGDMSIAGCYFMSDTHDGTAAIRQESAGGLKVVNTKINNRGISGGDFVDGISVAIGTGISTSILLVANSSIENVSGDGIDVLKAGTGAYTAVQVTGVQVGLYSNNAGRAVKLDSISHATIDGCLFTTDGTARAAVELTNTDNVVLGDIALDGFNARYTGSGDTNTDDNSP